MGDEASKVLSVGGGGRARTLLGVKQTSGNALRKSAFDPKLT